MEAIDLSARQQLYRERYNLGIARRVSNLLTDLEVDFEARLTAALRRLSEEDKRRYRSGNYTTDRLRRLRDIVRQFSIDWARIVQEQTERGGFDIVEAEIEFQRQFLAQFGSGLTLELGAAIVPSTLFNAVKRRPLQQATLRELFKDMTEGVRKRATRSLRNSWAAGLTNQQAVQALMGTKAADFKDGAININRNGATMMVRTAMNHYSNTATLESLRALGADRLIYVTVLDGRTSDICMDIGGKVVNANATNIRIPPLHPNCRTYLSFYDDDMDDMQMASKGQTSARPVQGDSETDKAYTKRLNTWKEGAGKTITAEWDRDKWLRRQNQAWVRDVVLTKEQWRIFKDGGSVHDFINKTTGRSYTSADLRRIYPPSQARAA